MTNYILSHVLCLFQALPTTLLHDFISDDVLIQWLLVNVYPFVPTIQAVGKRFPLSSSVPIPSHGDRQHHVFLSAFRKNDSSLFVMCW